MEREIDSPAASDYSDYATDHELERRFTALAVNGHENLFKLLNQLGLKRGPQSANALKANGQLMSPLNWLVLIACVLLAFQVALAPSNSDLTTSTMMPMTRNGSADFGAC